MINVEFVGAAIALPPGWKVYQYPAGTIIIDPSAEATKSEPSDAEESRRSEVSQNLRDERQMPAHRKCE